MYGNSSGGGTNFSAIDVCNTPSASGVTPITYTNTSQGSSATGASTKVFYNGMPAHNLGTSVSTSNGDEAGVSGGVVSGTFINSTRFTSGSYTVLVENKPGTKLTSVTIQNSTNGTGATISPAQTKVMLLAT
jgi:hypothetical protein